MNTKTLLGTIIAGTLVFAACEPIESYTCIVDEAHACFQGSYNSSDAYDLYLYSGDTDLIDGYFDGIGTAAYIQLNCEPSHYLEIPAGDYTATFSSSAPWDTFEAGEYINGEITGSYIYDCPNRRRNAVERCISGGSVHISYTNSVTVIFAQLEAEGFEYNMNFQGILYMDSYTKTLSMKVLDSSMTKRRIED